MKRLGEKKLSVLTGIVCLIVVSNLAATVQVNLNCPEKFIARVSAVNSPEAPSDPYAKTEIDLKVLEVLSGTSSQDEKKTLQILKYSAGNFQKGEMYQVSMRGPWLCDLKKLN